MNHFIYNCGWFYERLQMKCRRFSKLNWRKKLYIYYYYYLNKFQLFFKLDLVLSQTRNLLDQTRAKVLGWSLHFNIICGIAQGLFYLHEDSRQRNIHKNLKTSNVLLDGKMNPKTFDFGNQIEGNTNKVVGTQQEFLTCSIINFFLNKIFSFLMIFCNGHMVPEYAIDGLFSVKFDVFSFEILLLEILSGKKN